jgi:hypothetical protein
MIKIPNIVSPTQKGVRAGFQPIESGTELFSTDENAEIWIEPTSDGIVVHENPDPSEIKPHWYMPAIAEG